MSSLGLANKLTSYLGGFYLSKHGLRSNAPKIIHLLLLISTVAVFFVDFYIPQIIVSVVIALYITVIKIIAYELNKLMDNGQIIDVPIEEDEENQRQHQQNNNEITLPPGISRQLWERRGVLFEEGQEEGALNLIETGFDANEVFALVALINNGTINRATKLAEEPETFHHTEVTIMGKKVILKLDRETLSRIVDRPNSIFEIILCFFLAALTIFATGNVTDNPNRNVYNVFSLMIALFSLTLAPSTDRYSTTINDPCIKYTRCFTICIFAAAQRLMYFVGLHYDVFLYMIMFLPLLIDFGVVGHPVLIIHWFFEQIDLYIFGVCGCPTLLSSIIDFVLNCVNYAVIFVLFYFLKEREELKVFFVMIYVSVLGQVSSSNTRPNLRIVVKSILYCIFSIAGSAVAVFLSDVPYWYIFVPAIFFVTDACLPWMNSYSQYGIFHGRIIKLEKSYLFDVLSVVRSFLISLYIAKSFVDSEMEKGVAFYIYIVSGLSLFRMALSVPYVGFLCTFFASLLLNYEFQVSDRLCCMFWSTIITMKLINVYRIMCSKFKFNCVMPIELSSVSQFYFDVIINLIFEIVPDPRSTVSTFSLAWGLFIGEPPRIATGLYFFSPPKPFSFYQSLTQNKSITFTSSDTSHNIELPAYVSMSEGLKQKLSLYIQTGRFGLVFPDSFFLLMLDNMMCIVHVISIGVHQCYFECRFLEYQEQTICHDGESSLLEQFVIEERQFGNTGHSVSYRFSAYELIAKDIKIESLSMSQIGTDTIFVCGKDKMNYWLLVSSAYTSCHLMEIVQKNGVKDAFELSKKVHQRETVNETEENRDDAESLMAILENELERILDNDNQSTQNETTESEVVIDTASDTRTNTNNGAENTQQETEQTQQRGELEVNENVQTEENIQNAVISMAEAFLEGGDTDFSDSELQLIADIAQHYNRNIPDIVSIVQFIYTNIHNRMNSSQSPQVELMDFFNNNFKFIDQNLMRLLLVTSSQLYVVLLLMESVGLAPCEDDKDELFSYIDECLETKTFSLDAEDLVKQLTENQSPTIMIQPGKEANTSTIVRFGVSEQEWNVFALQTGTIRGFWSNESGNILLNAISFSERASIQFSATLLRNITNQSCNPPVGYPVLITNILPTIY